MIRHNKPHMCCNSPHPLWWCSAILSFWAQLELLECHRSPWWSWSSVVSGKIDSFVMSCIIDYIYGEYIIIHACTIHGLPLLLMDYTSLAETSSKEQWIFTTHRLYLCEHQTFQAMVLPN